MLIKANQSILLVIDIQDRLAPAVHDSQRTIRNTDILAQAAKRLGVPVFFTEQYPKGLGHTIGELAQHVTATNLLEKIHFSCMGDVNAKALLKDRARAQVVITGMETHVCVLQSALELKEAGFQPFIVQDAVASRTLENKQAGIERMRAAGLDIVTTEMVVFEWLNKAATDEFKELIKLIK